MAAKVEFLFDFGSPNAYLAYRVIPEIERRTGATFEPVPVLLGGIFKATGNQSPVQAFANVKGKLEYQRVEFARFLRRYGIGDFSFNPFFPVNTLALMRMAVAAEEEGTLAPYMAAAFRHMWVEPKKMDDAEVIKAALAQSGLDPALLERAQAPAVKAKLIANTEAAVARGVFGAPTFFVGDEMFFGKDKLRDVEEALVAAA